VGVILAGGQSTRMGQDKASLPLEGETLLDVMVSKLRNLRPLVNKVIVSGCYPHYPSLSDIKENLGPLGGMHTVLSNPRFSAEGGFILFVPVDLPKMQSSILKKLIIGLNSGEKEACSFQDHALPAVFRVTNRLKSLLDQKIKKEKNLSIKQLLEELDSLELKMEKDDETCFLNMNEYSQWKKYQDELKSQAQSASI